MIVRWEVALLFSTVGVLSAALVGLTIVVLRMRVQIRLLAVGQAQQASTELQRQRRSLCSTYRHRQIAERLAQL